MPAKEVGKRKAFQRGGVARNSGEHSRELEALRAERDALRADLQEERLAHESLAKAFDRAGMIYWISPAKSDEVNFGLRGGNLLGGERSVFGKLPPSEDELAKKIHPDDAARVSRVYEEAESAGTDFRVDYRMLGRDGAYHDVRDYGVAEFDSAGQFLGHVGCCQDLTDLKKAEVAQLKSETRFREFFESAPISLWEEDWSQLKGSLDEISLNSVADWDAYFADRQDELSALHSKVRFVEINQASVALYRTQDKRAVLEFLRSRDFSGAKLRHWGGFIAAFAAGRTEAVLEVPETTLDGSEMLLRMRAVIDSDATPQWSRVYFSVEDVTDRFEAEQRFSSVFQNANLAILLVSLDGRILEVNERACDWLGYAQAELCGMTVMEITHPEDLGETVGNLAKVASSEVDSLVVEKRYLRKDQEVVWGLLSTRASRDAQGRAHYFVSAIQDITELKLAQIDLRDREALLQGVIDTLPFIVSVKDRDGRFLYANQFMENFYGYDGPGLVGRTIAELFIAVPDADGVIEQIRKEDIQVVTTGEAIPFFEDRLLIKGRHRDLYTTKVPLADAIGEIKYVVTVAIDITDRKEAEDALRKSEERFRVLFAHAPDAVVILDPDTGRFVDANRNAVRLFGIARDQLLELDPLELSPPHQCDGTASAESAKAHIAAAMKGETPSFEWVFLDANGQEIVCEVRLVRLEFQDRIFVRGSILDISERKAIEDQLRQSQKMEAVGHMTGGVAHDFNNLLGVIVGNLELAAERLGEDERTRDLLNRALEAADRGSKTTQQLLAFSRRQPLQPQATDAGKLLSGMMDLLRRSLGETIELQLEVEPGLWLCDVDPGQMESSLLNLALNAVDAMPEGGTLGIRLGNVTLDEEARMMDAEAGDYVRVSVSDSGAGMPAEIKARAFEPFFTTKEVGRGTGLGLSMVYGFVRQSGGYVTLESEPGEGATFELFLPRATVVKSEPARHDERDPPRATGEQVLVVEDDEDLRDLAVHLLSDLGYGVRAARDAPHALALLREQPAPDLVLSDLVLPGGMNGRQLADEVMRLHPKTKILFMSGYTRSTIVHDGRLDEDIELLQKPFRRADLARAVRRALIDPIIGPV